MVTQLSEFLESARGKVTVVNDRWAVSTVKLPALTYDVRWGSLDDDMHWETMVFPVREGVVDFGERDCNRYRSEAESLAGHDAMVAKWSLLDAAGKADGAMYPDALPED